MKRSDLFAGLQFLVISGKRNSQDSLRLQPRGLVDASELATLEPEKERPELLFAPFPMTEPKAMPSIARAGDGGWLVWSDVDHRLRFRQEAWVEKLDAWALESGTPGRRQIFIRLDSATPAHHIEALNRALCEKLDGDQSKINRAAIMRLPAGFNTKGGKRRSPRLVRESERVWSAPELASALGTELPDTDTHSRPVAVTETPTAIRNGDARYGRVRHLIRTANQRFEEGTYKSRHGLIYSLGLSCIEAGVEAPSELLWVMEQCEAAVSKASDEGKSISHHVGLILGKVGTSTPAQSESAGVRDEPAVTSADDADDDLSDGGSDLESAVSRMMLELLDSSAMDTQADPEPLIDSWLFVDSVARVVGPPGSMKSFIAIDLSAHIGMGAPWRGNDVKKGPVIYLLAEGSKGAKKRKQAWEKHYGKPMENVLFLPRAIQVLGDEWPVFVEVCKRVKPVLVVLDTQSRISAGVDENSNDSTAFNRVDDIREVTGACVLLLHHPPKDGKGGRGGSVWIGGLDTELWVEKKGKVANGDCVVTLENEKQKDEADGLKLQFAPKVIDLGKDEKGKRRTSLVLTSDMDVIVASQLKAIDRVLKFITDADTWVTADEIAEGLGVKSVRDYLPKLEANGEITSQGIKPKKYRATL
ncbi:MULTISPECIES: AAA family ATPase [unclassified Streptomyces]|uniref:AAA family ATPase n=1 Tax=unclassified Streptomyces TaxID=2593676 RepID=UPI0036E73843